MTYFTLAETDTDTDSDSDSTFNDYIVQCRNFQIPWSQIQIPIPTVNYMNGDPESNSGSESVSGNVIKPLNNAISFIRRL